MPKIRISKEWLIETNGFCVICEELVGRAQMVADHDHVTGFLRGSICRRCNVLLGMAQDKTRTLINAVKYLRYWDKANQEHPNVDEALQRHARGVKWRKARAAVNSQP